MQRNLVEPNPFNVPNTTTNSQQIFNTPVLVQTWPPSGNKYPKIQLTMPRSTFLLWLGLPLDKLVTKTIKNIRLETLVLGLLRRTNAINSASNRLMLHPTYHAVGTKLVQNNSELLLPLLLATQDPPVLTVNDDLRRGRAPLAPTNELEEKDDDLRTPPACVDANPCTDETEPSQRATLAGGISTEP